MVLSSIFTFTLGRHRDNWTFVIQHTFRAYWYVLSLTIILWCLQYHTALHLFVLFILLPTSNFQQMKLVCCFHSSLGALPSSYHIAKVRYRVEQSHVGTTDGWVTGGHPEWETSTTSLWPDILNIYKMQIAKCKMQNAKYNCACVVIKAGYLIFAKKAIWQANMIAWAVIIKKWVKYSRREWSSAGQATQTNIQTKNMQLFYEMAVSVWMWIWYHIAL